MRAPHRGLTLVWSPLESTDRYCAWLAKCGASPILCSTIPALVDQVKAGARALVFAPALDHLPKQFDLFCRVAWECQGARVVVEELSRVTGPSWAPPAWSNLSTAGAHRRLELIATAQRPTMIDKNFLGNCTEIRCYRLLYEEDARALGRLLRVPHVDLMDLADLHYSHRVVRERLTSAGVQAIAAM